MCITDYTLKPGRFQFFKRRATVKSISSNIINAIRYFDFLKRRAIIKSVITDIINAIRYFNFFKRRTIFKSRNPD